MKKISAVCIMASAVVAVSTLAGCNVVKGGKIEEIAGTYHLVEYTMTRVYDASNKIIPTEERVTVNYIEDYGMDVYVVINQNGYGYYYYDDNEIDAYCVTVKQNYVYEDEYDEKTEQRRQTDKIEKIELDDGTENRINLYVQSNKDKKTFTDNTSAWQTSIKGPWSGHTYYIGNKANISIKYERVDKAQDLTYINNKVNAEITCGAFEYTPFVRTPVFVGSSTGNTMIYEYYVFNAKANQVTRYYAEKSETPEKKEEVLEFSYDASQDKYIIGGEYYDYGKLNGFTLYGMESESYYEIASYGKSANAVKENFDTLIQEYLEAYDVGEAS